MGIHLTRTERECPLCIVQAHKGIWFGIVPGSHPILLTSLSLSYHKGKKKSKTAYTTTVFHLPRI